MPEGTNFLGVAYSYTRGDLHFDPALRIEDARIEMHTGVLAYSRYFGLFGKTARVDAQLPFQSGSWDGLLDGVPARVSRDGLGDPRLRLSVNLFGAPALPAPEFLEFRAANPVRTTVGAALSLQLPFGEYERDKLINLGGNRVVIRPQLGVLHTHGPWSFELTGSAWFYSDNDEFFGGNELAQDPLIGGQAHVVRTFESSIWVSAGVAYGLEGETRINGVREFDSRSNLLYGLSFGFPVASNQAVRLGYVRGDTLTDTGADTHSLLVTWTLRF